MEKGCLALPWVIKRGQHRQNREEDRKDRRLAENQNPDKRCVLAMRERGEGGRTFIFIVKTENQDAITKLAKRFIDRETKVFADECPAYNNLHGIFKTFRVNHSIEYVAKDGTNTNLVESFFSRFRRMHIGQYHKFGLGYLANYANEAAYREYNRRMSNGDMFKDILGRCAASKPSRDFSGYWQGNKRREALAVG